MALQYSLGYTNKSKTGAVDYSPYVIDIADYTIPAQTDGLSIMRNNTCPADQEEVISYKVVEKQSVDFKHNKLAHPAKQGAYKAIEVLDEVVLRETSTIDDTYMVDYPITVQLSFRFPVHPAVTDLVLAEIAERVLGSLRDSDGTGSRLDNLMRGQTFPTT
jgi:hypothetical protein